jgi:hypothetical protein
MPQKKPVKKPTPSLFEDYLDEEVSFVLSRST